MIPLEQQCCSLELAQQLKGLGVKQESVWYWVYHYNYDGVGEGPTKWSLFQKDEDDKVNEHVSAFTVAELGELLPEGYATYRHGSSWFVAKNHDPVLEKIPVAVAIDTEANCRAFLLIHLIEKGYVKAGEI